jgi:cytochrome c553
MKSNGLRSALRSIVPKPFVALLLVFLGLPAGAGQVWAADVAAGKEMAEGCAGCHGADGISQMELTPSLAGEPDEFVQWQLVFFRSGARKNEVMGAIAGALNNEDIRNLGAYYASLKPPKPEPASPDDALAVAGFKLAVGHRCRSCHSDDFTGMLSAARLAGQREDVLLKALRDFKSGLRVGTGVASMSEVVAELNDDDMKALAHFLSTRP